MTLGVALHRLPATVWGINVCDDEQYFLNKVASDVADWQRRYPQVPAVAIVPRVLDGYVGQGYAIAKPMPVLQFETWLSQWQAPDTWKASASHSA